MENCLVSTLKSSAENNELCSLNGLLLDVPANSDIEVRTAQDVAITKTLIGGNASSVYFCSNTSYNDNLGQTIKSSQNAMYIHNGLNEKVKLKLESRYAIKRMFDWGYQGGCVFSSYFADGEFLQNLPLLTELLYVGDLESTYLKNCSHLTKLDLIGSQIPAYLDDISNITTLTNLKLFNMSVRGDISSLASLTSLTKLELAYLNGISNGTIESLLEGMLNNGRTSGTLDVHVYSNTNKITFHGVEPSSSQHYIATFSSGSISVSLNSTVVATYDGSTWTYNS